MLQSDLLRVRISHGKIYPTYATLNTDNLRLAERISDTFKQYVGRKKGELLDELKEFEGFDYKLVRGLSTLLERRCIFEPDTRLNPKEVRMVVFEEASKARVSTLEQRDRIIRDVSAKLNLDASVVEKALYSDVEDELVLRDFRPLPPDVLIRYYNFSLTQTLLFKSLRVDFSASGNWKNIFRAIKRLGLMYSIEKTTSEDQQQGRGDGNYTVFVDGPLSLFKMTERYGTSIAKLLPHIIASERWKIRAEVLARNKQRIYNFEGKSEEVKGLIEDVFLKSEQAGGEGEGGGQGPFRSPLRQRYDSTVEERFARAFEAYNSGWLLKREPEPLLAGRHVLIPDFSFEKYGLKVYLEIVGFWTQEYLERKIQKLTSLIAATNNKLDLLVAADEGLACSKLDKLTKRSGGSQSTEAARITLIYYTKDVPVKPIVGHLKSIEEGVIEREANVLKSKRIELKEDVVTIEKIAQIYNAPVEAARRSLRARDFEGYKRIGDCFVAVAKLKELEDKVAKLGGEQIRLSDAVEIVEEYGLENPHQVLEALGYTVEWNVLDYEKATIRRTAEASSLIG
jgi:predicted nuclease of restriction endonuclease-like RecB superfamily